MKEASDWVAFLGGVLVGCLIGGTIVYLIMLQRAQSVIKTFAYDTEGRLIQVLKEYGV